MGLESGIVPSSLLGPCWGGALAVQGGGGVSNPFVLAPSASQDWVSFFAASMTEPTRPAITSTGSATTQQQLRDALATGGVHVTIPTGTTIGATDHNSDVNWSDTLITIQSGARLDGLAIDRFSGTATTARLMIQGPGELGYLQPNNGKTSDLILSGLKGKGAAGANTLWLEAIDLNRLGIYDCVIKAPTSGTDGACISARGNDAFIIGSNLRGTGSTNGWCLRGVGALARRLIYGCQFQAPHKSTIRQGDGIITDMYMRASHVACLDFLQAYHDLKGAGGLVSSNRIRGDQNVYYWDDRDSPGMGLLFGGVTPATGNPGTGSLSFRDTGGTHHYRAALTSALSSALPALQAAQIAAGVDADYTTGVTYVTYASAAALDAGIRPWPTISGPNVPYPLVGGGFQTPTPAVLGSDPALL